MNKRYKRKTIKKKIVKAFKSKCCICKKKFHPVVFDFHHINSYEKNMTIGDVRISKKNQNDVFTELTKCVMLCSNCHRMLHYGLVELKDDDIVSISDKYKKQSNLIKL